MENQKQEAKLDLSPHGPHIVPKSTDIRLTSDASAQDLEVGTLNQHGDGRQTRRSSDLFRRLMSMDTFQSMSARNLLVNNPVFRKRACSIVVNVVSRALTLGMNVLLVLLSTAFCVAQLSEVHLKLYNECEPKTLEEIYHHSYLAGLGENGSVEINAESQWGHTDDACYTTRSFQENTDQLWHSNFYEHEWNIFIDYKVVFFAMASLYSFCILVYNVINLVRDIHHLKQNTVHTLANASRGQPNSREQETRAWSRFTKWLNEILETEDTRWVVRCVLSECVEFCVAVTSMLLYNGYNWNDPENEDDVYLAEKPQFIVLFAAGLAVNMFGSAFLWMSYMAAPETCHGLTFRTAFFFVEDLSDLFYALFPVIVAYNDTYNANADELLVLLGQFHVEDWMSFWPRFFFLSILCFKTHHLVYSSHAQLINRYYSEFNLEEVRVNWIKEDDPNENDKRCFLFGVSAMYILGGIFVLFLVLMHFDEARTHCNSVQETIFMVDGVFTADVELPEEQRLLLETNPELFLWEKCLYQTLPFTENEQHRCQCRVFVVDWDILEPTPDNLEDLGLSQSMILDGMLKNNIMLEKFESKGELTMEEFTFNAALFKSVHMKAFKWLDKRRGLEQRKFSINDFGDYMISWAELEYLDIVVDCHFGDFKNFKRLLTLKHLHIELECGGWSDKAVELDSICSLQKLQFLNIALLGESTVPHCFGNLLELIVLDLQISMSLREMPLSLLRLPKLKRLDVYKGKISWEGLLEYNVPLDVDRNDVVAVQMWLSSHFSINENADFFFQLNPICDEIPSVGWDEFRDLLDRSCDYGCDAGSENSFCNPQFIGDGICQTSCNLIGCNYDGGDCMQLCFAEELTSCKWEDLLNAKCDESCNNDYCSAYGNLAHVWGTDEMKSDPDFQSCGAYVVNEECQSSSIGSQFLETSVSWTSNDVCQSEWVGDGLCDDLCHTSECSNDGGDCELTCGGGCAVIGSIWSNINWAGSWKIDHDTYCLLIWESMKIAVVSDFPGSDDCQGTLQSLDFNQDGSLNFREFTALSGVIGGGIESSRYLQINCSSCMAFYDAPMEWYNF